MRLVSVTSLKSGLTLARTIYDSFGRVLLVKGTPLTQNYINRLRELRFASVYIDDNYSHLIEIDEVVSQETRAEVFGITREALLHVRDSNGFEENKIIQAVSNIIDEIISCQEVLIHLVDIRSLADHTFNHSVNVCILALATGLAMGYNQSKLMELGTGALLHDIGKAKILDKVNSEKRLRKRDFKLIQQHCNYGYEILCKSKNIGIMAAHIAWEHHEKYNGSGYPRGLSGKAIKEFARIVTVADVYDALTGDRPYRERILPNKVLEIIEAGQGFDFDSDVVDEFKKIIAPYPVGSIVILNSGIRAKVISVQKLNPTRPKVRLLSHTKGLPVPESLIIDLKEHRSVSIVDVIRE